MLGTGVASPRPGRTARQASRNLSLRSWLPGILISHANCLSEAANGNVIDRLEVATANIGGEGVEVAGVGFYGMSRRVALAQMAEEVVSGTLDDGAACLGGASQLSNLPYFGSRMMLPIHAL